jgi:hypothetical protein
MTDTVVFQYARFRLLCMLLMLPFLFLHIRARAQSPILKVGESGAYLYLHDDTESEKIETLQAGEEVIKIIQTIGRGSWYLVRTRGGRVGWLKASDIEPIKRYEQKLKADETRIRFGPASTWRASTRRGRTLSGTWAGEINPSDGTASGTWAVRDGKNRIVLSGTWSAAKSALEWRGSWRALVTGQPGERSGTWNSGVQLPADVPLAKLFEGAMQQIISGAWQSKGQSGTWSIRAAQ